MNVFDKIKQSFIKEQSNNIERAKQAIKTRNEEMKLARKELEESISNKEMNNNKAYKLTDMQPEDRFKPAAYANLEDYETVRNEEMKLARKELEESISNKEMNNNKTYKLTDMQPENRFKPAYANLDGSEAIDMPPENYFEENKQTENNFKSEMKKFGEIFAEFKKVYSEYEKINSKLQKTFSKLEKSYSNLLDKTFSYDLKSIKENTVPSFRNKEINEIKKVNRETGKFMSSTQLSNGNTVPSFRNKGIDEIKKANQETGEFMSSTQLSKENTVPSFRNKGIDEIKKDNQKAEEFRRETNSRKENAIAISLFRNTEINSNQKNDQEIKKTMPQNNSSEIYLKQKKVEEFNKKAIINGSKERAELLENGEIAIKEMKAEPLNKKEEKTTKGWTR